jgi:hypothetical protein
MPRVVSVGPSPPPRRAPRKPLASRPPVCRDGNLCVEPSGAERSHVFVAPSRRMSRAGPKHG